MTDEFNRVPPASLEAEKCVLASLMLDGGLFGQISKMIDRDDFYQADHQIIFDVLKKLYQQGRPVDAVVVRDELATRQLLEEVGGAAYLAAILNSVPHASDGVRYAGTVQEKALRRRLLAAFSETICEAYDPSESIEVLLDNAQRRVLELTKGITRAVRSSDDVLHDVFELIETRGGRGIETGFFELDDMLNGLQDGELVIIAGRPAMGKSAMAANIVEHVAANCAIPCAVFTMEMTKEQYVQRLICSRAQLDSHRLRKGMLHSEEYAHLASVVGELAKAPLFFASLPGVTLAELCRSIRTTVAQTGARLVVIDYVQLIECKGDNRTEQLTLVSRRLKALALELRVPVICISEMNRGMFQPEMTRPRMKDLRGSGTLEDEADVVLLIHREDYDRMNEPDFQPDNIAEVIIAKQRNGPTGTVKLIFTSKSVRFENLSTVIDPF